jgi:hypothetical protein
MRWLTQTHTQRWRAARHSVGSGALYQGRFKRFPIETDEHFLILCRYVERNALRPSWWIESSGGARAARGFDRMAIQRRGNG